jgi:hypothetical protein
MGIYYIPVPKKLAEDVLKRGLARPKPPHASYIELFESVEKAADMGRLLYSKQYEVLEVQGNLKVHDGLHRWQTILKSGIPAKMLSSTSPPGHLKDSHDLTYSLQNKNTCRFADSWYREYQLVPLADGITYEVYGPGLPAWNHLYNEEPLPLLTSFEAISWIKARIEIDIIVGEIMERDASRPMITVYHYDNPSNIEEFRLDCVQYGTKDFWTEAYERPGCVLDDGTVVEPGWYWSFANRVIDIEGIEEFGPFELLDDAITSIKEGFENGLEAIVEHTPRRMCQP